MADFLEGTLNPYHVPPGPELDGYIHQVVLHEIGPCPSYSSRTSDANLLKRWIEEKYDLKITIGKSTVSKKPWFARYEIDEGNPTEVLAETYPLVICRLVLLRVMRR
jgi:hypothetical protein